MELQEGETKNENMKIIIPKQTIGSITEEIGVELDNYTILAGENNSGKTNLIKAIMDHDDLKGYKIIHIPAEEIDPDDKETKLSTKKDPFYQIMETILDPIFNTEMFESLIADFNSSDEKNKFVDGVNKILGELGVDKKKFDVKILQEDLKKDLIIKVTKAIVKDLYDSDVEDVDLENIGTGTRRMIVAALIQYYAYSKINDGEKIILVFEEPEAYLHPKWKKGLYESLFKISENSKVLVTTHDPYFIELGKSQKIYRVHRDLDPAKKDATAVSPIEEPKKGDLLPYKSSSEINYLIFGVASREYFLEIYENLKRRVESSVVKSELSCKKFDQHMFETYFKLKGVAQNHKDDNGDACLAVTRLRHNIAHGKNIDEALISIETATEDLRGFLGSL